MMGVTGSLRESNVNSLSRRGKSEDKITRAKETIPSVISPKKEKKRIA